MNLQLYFLFICSVALAAEVPTTSPVPATQQSVTNTPTTKKPIDPNVKPICSKCHCIKEQKMVDCSSIHLSSLFTEDEWATLNSSGMEFETMKFSHNKLTEIPVFPTLAVKSLIFTFNQIGAIAPSAFANLKNLESLDFSRNSLNSSKLNPLAFQGEYSPTEYLPIDSMKHLNLAHNQLHSLNSDLFEHFPNLETVILTGNVFKVIDRSTEIALGNIPKLKYLDMSYMELEVIPEFMLHTPRSLEVLNLTGNLLHTIPRALAFGINLKELILDENPIVAFDGDNVFPKLNNLEILSISYMEFLKKIGKGAFSNLPNLKKLMATDNLNLIEIHPFAFAQTENGSSDARFPPLEELLLKDCSLATLDNELLDRWDKLKRVDIRYNKWRCDCDNKWVVNELYSQIKRDTPNLTTDLICASPPPMRGKSISDLNEKKISLRCGDAHENHPEKDGAILIGILIGLLVGIPMTFALVVAWRRGCFGIIGGTSPGDYSRAFYKRADLSDDAY